MNNKSSLGLLKELNIKMKLLNGNKSTEYKYRISSNKRRTSNKRRPLISATLFHTHITETNLKHIRKKYTNNETKKITSISGIYYNAPCRYRT